MIGHMVTDTAAAGDGATDHVAEIGSKNGDNVFPFAIDNIVRLFVLKCDLYSLM